MMRPTTWSRRSQRHWCLYRPSSCSFPRPRRRW
uniref:Uncharacterized protein n=1 Tax=Arundo donax TaxID=35708 RepID=A0A0A9ERJ1_ARUDO